MQSFRIDLALEMERLLQEPSFQRGDRTARTLLKEPHLRLTLVAMKPGARLDPHQTDGPLTVYVLRGALRVSAESEPTELTAGQLLALETGVTHAVEAPEESFFLLTLSWPRPEHR